MVDTFLAAHPELIHIASDDVLSGCISGNLGRGDTPGVEQIVRAAIYKELKGLDYREPEYEQSDSRICEHFMRIDPLRPYSFQMFQKYIAKIKKGTIEKLLFEINRIAIEERMEDVEKIRRDSTVVESNIHYPTNNSLR